MTSPTRPSARKSVTIGVILIAIGALSLLSQFDRFDQIELFFLPVLAAVFLVSSVATRTFGLLIPGGVLAGIAAGSLLVEGPLASVSEPASGAIFLLAFAAGWLLISLLSPLTKSGFEWWPLIPAGILALVGGLLLIGDAGLQVLKVIGYAWPVVLIAVGAWIILRRRPRA